MPIYKTKNENFFKKWSSDMAYVLGFITADGALVKTKRNTHFLDIQSTDKEIIYSIQKVFRSNLIVNEYRPKNANYSNRYRLQIGSKKIFHDLIQLGVTPRKSKTMKLMYVPHAYFPHFLRGYFDGDGCVNVCTYQKKDRKNPSTIINCGFTSGSKRFLIHLKKNLLQLGIVKGGTLYYHQGYRLWFSINDSFSLYKYMYNDLQGNLLLPRKKKVFENYFNKSRIKDS